MSYRLEADPLSGSGTSGRRSPRRSIVFERAVPAGTRMMDDDQLEIPAFLRRQAN